MQDCVSEVTVKTLKNTDANDDVETFEDFALAA